VRHIEVSLLQLRVDGEQKRARFDLIPFAHLEPFEATGLIRTDKNQIGFDPPLEAGIVLFGACCEERCGD
jgi:hypothetical protein